MTPPDPNNWEKTIKYIDSLEKAKIPYRARVLDGNAILNVNVNSECAKKARELYESL